MSDKNWFMKSLAFHVDKPPRLRPRKPLPGQQPLGLKFDDDVPPQAETNLEKEPSDGETQCGEE